MNNEITVEWLALLFRIHEIPGSNLGAQIGYSNRLTFLRPSTVVPR